MVDAPYTADKHLSVRCNYEVALPTAVNDSGVQPQLLVPVRNVRASRQWRTTGLLDVDTPPGHPLCDPVGAEKSMRTAHATSGTRVRVHPAIGSS